MPKEMYRITINIERDSFDPMTDEQWKTYCAKMDEEDFNNPFTDVVETAMEIEALMRTTKGAV